MRAIGKFKAGVGLQMQDVPMPSVGHNDVLIRVQKTAICGTDLHIYAWDEWAQRTVPVPMTTGHEFMGIVEEVGAEVAGIKIGSRVAGEGHLTCGHCRNCRAGKRHLCRNTVGIGVNRPGCFADYVVIPASNVFCLPDNIPDDIAAIFDPFGNAVHTVLSFDLVGEDVLITGAGPIGIMAAAIARFVGARNVVVSDVNDYRLALANKMGATRVVNVQKEPLAPVMYELGMTEGFDIGLEMSGNSQALSDMFSLVTHGARIAILGIPPKPAMMDWNPVIFKGLVIKGIYGREMFETWYKMTTLLQSGLNINPIITGQYPAEDYEKAFQVMREGNTGKVILNW